MEEFFQSTILPTLQFNQDNQLNNNQGTLHFDADAAKAGLFEWEHNIFTLIPYSFITVAHRLERDVIDISLCNCTKLINNSLYQSIYREMSFSYTV